MTNDNATDNPNAFNFLMDAQKAFYEQMCLSQNEERQRQELERKHRNLGLTTQFHSGYEQQPYQMPLPAFPFQNCRSAEMMDYNSNYEQPPYPGLLPANHSQNHRSEEMMDALQSSMDIERSQDFSLFPLGSLEQDDLIASSNVSTDQPLLRNSRLRRASLDLLATMFENDDSLNQFLKEGDDNSYPYRNESHSLGHSSCETSMPPVVPSSMPPLTNSKIFTELNLYNRLVNLQEAMQTTQGSQEKLHEMDRAMGLKKSHSRTMRSSFQSRKKLIKKQKKETRRLAPRVTVLTGSLPKQTKPSTARKTINKEIKLLPSSGNVIIRNPMKKSHVPHAA
mmetsp:Transcript_28738/g.37557  ORF Transcript_28738/g.37557 Transcript_28738/m.37557 type:complete len:337 (+) Transcript_28738:82-1092(+)